ARAALAAWRRGLPGEVRSGPMPTQGEADAWTQRETLGLVPAFPARIDAQTRIMLAAALATKVSWETPFAVTQAVGQLGPQSPWTSDVSMLLWDDSANGRAMIARTEAAGPVAVHCAVTVAEEDMTVVSVSAAPDVDRAAVCAAAYEVAAGVCRDWG